MPTLVCLCWGKCNSPFITEINNADASMSKNVLLLVTNGYYNAIP